MSILKFYATKDTTITDSFLSNLLTRATASNMGASDSLEVFSLYGQASSSSLEKSRILIEFPTTDIQASRSAGVIPTSGNVNFVLRMFNVEHPYTLPKDYYLNVSPISKSWDEGYGLDMEGYSDFGFNGARGYGTNWIYAKSGSSWTSQGGDFLNTYNYSHYFKDGVEDIELDITGLVESWLTGSITNNGLAVRMSGSYETGSFYTKKFSARGTEFFYKKPCIEARWAPQIKDDRGAFFNTSSVLSDTDNTMKLVYYNRINKVLQNIYNTPTLIVKFYANSNYTNEIAPIYTSSVTNPQTGIYSLDVRINTTASILYDKWFISSSLIPVYSSSVTVKNISDFVDSTNQYVVNITNLKPIYKTGELVKFKLYSRNYDWQPTVYTVANNTLQNNVIKNLYYKIFRVEDNYTIIDYSTGSVKYSQLDYDVSGNYFELNTSLFEKDYSYAIKFAIYDGVNLSELREKFKFRIE